jgi:hypothetical protein
MVENDILANACSFNEEESNRVKLNLGNAPSVVTNAQNLTSAASNSFLVPTKKIGRQTRDSDAELQSRGADALRPIARVEIGNCV